jgi:hypothetical protein
MTPRKLAMALSMILFAAMFVRNAQANAAVPASDDQAVAAQAMSSGAIAMSGPAVMIITANQPVAIPGRVLEAGKYSFELINGTDQVKVATADGSRIYGVYFVIPAQRGNAGDDAVYVARDNGGPSRIASWFFAGQKDGYALVYPHAKRNAAVLARAGAN